MGLESGLADYFPSSFENRSDIWQPLGLQFSNRNLDNHRSFSEIRIGKTEEHDAGDVWGGAFFELRQTIGQKPTDKLLLAAWKELDLSKPYADMMTFPLELLKQDRSLEEGRHLQQIHSVFSSRGLQF